MSYDQLDLNILKALTTNKKCAIDFTNEYDDKLFDSSIWNFAKIVIDYVKVFKEVPTHRVLSEKLSKNVKLLDYVDKIWKQLETINYDEKEFKYDLEKLKKRYAQKQISSTKDILDKLENGGIDAFKAANDIQKTIQTVKSLNQVKLYERKTLKDTIPEFVDKFNAKKNNLNPENRIKTGYSFFDFATNGVKSSDFIIIAGESGFGKSLLLSNMGIQIWLQGNDIYNLNDFKPGKNVVYFSLEMEHGECFDRLLSRLSGVPSRKIENATLNKEEFAKVKAALDFIKAYPYNFEIIDITNATSNNLKAILDDIDYDIDAVFIDYLGIMQPNESKEENDWLKQNAISFEIREIARQYKIPVFSAVQLNRKSPTKDPEENVGLHRLARSLSVGHHSTHILQIFSRPQEENHCDMMVFLIKNRKGPKGRGILLKNLACATLLDKPIEKDENTPNYNDYFNEVEDISEEIGDLEI